MVDGGVHGTDHAAAAGRMAAETVTFSDVTDRNTAMAVETLRLMDVLEAMATEPFGPRQF
jgi:hypothetical protein